MSQISPFVHYFVEEALKKASLHTLLNADMHGACEEIHDSPVDITPKMFRNHEDIFLYQDPEFLRVYPSKKDSENYLEKSEQLNESTHDIQRQCVFGIRGNRRNIVCGFYGENSDINIINSAVHNYYPNSITDVGVLKDFTGDLFVYDFIPDAPFYRSLTSYKSYVISPLNVIPRIFLDIDDDRLGAYYVSFTPASPECHRLVKDAIDTDYRTRLDTDGRVPPSLQNENQRVDYKSPEFKSYFFVCVRIILPKDSLVGSVKAFISNYTYGSKSFRTLDNNRYSQEQIQAMLDRRASYHSGFLLNSHELTSLLHVPYQVLDDKAFEGVFLEAPAGDKPLKTLEYEDIPIGVWACGSFENAVHLPVQREIPHVHVLGVSRSGKSVLLGYMAVEKFKRGEAVFLFDPHGDLVENVLKMLPEGRMDDVVLVDFGLEDATPQITIRENIDIVNPSKASDDLSEAMRDVSSSSEKYWGPKMSYYFACLYYVFCVLPDLMLADLRLLVSRSPKAKNLRNKVKARISHPIVRDFLEEIDFISYESLVPVLTRLSHVLLDEKSLRLFTLDTNRISVSDILETGKLCLINLSIGIIGKQRSSILSGLMDSLINNNALARAKIPYSKRKPCTVIKDEFYLGPGDIESQLVGYGKYGLSVVFANQYLTQVDGQTRDVLGTAGTRIVFKVRRADAEVIGRDFGIDPDELTSLRKFQAFVKIEDEVVKINTPRPAFNQTDYSREIMRRSLEKYYLVHSESGILNKTERLSFDTL